MWSVALYPLNCDHLIYSIHMFRVRLEYLCVLPGISWYSAGISNYLVNSPWVSILLRVKLDPLWLLWKEEKDIPLLRFKSWIWIIQYMVRMNYRKDNESSSYRQPPSRQCGKTQRKGGGGKEIHGNLCLTLTVNLLIDTFSKHFLVK